MENNSAIILFHMNNNKVSLIIASNITILVYSNYSLFIYTNIIDYTFIII